MNRSRPALRLLAKRSFHPDLVGAGKDYGQWRSHKTTDGALAPDASLVWTCGPSLVGGRHERRIHSGARVRSSVFCLAAKQSSVSSSALLPSWHRFSGFRILQGIRVDWRRFAVENQGLKFQVSDLPSSVCQRSDLQALANAALIRSALLPSQGFGAKDSAAGADQGPRTTDGGAAAQLVEHQTSNIKHRTSNAQPLTSKLSPSPAGFGAKDSAAGARPRTKDQGPRTKD